MTIMFVEVVVCDDVCGSRDWRNMLCRKRYLALVIHPSQKIMSF